MNPATNSLIESNLAKAAELYDRGKVPQAEVLFQEVLKHDPDNLHALHSLGLISIEKRRPQQAAALFRHAIEIDATRRAFHNNLGHALQNLGQFEAALQSYDNAIRLDPNYASAYYNRGDAARALGRLDLALASYDRVIDLNPKDAEAYNNRGVVLNDLTRLDEALESYGKAILHRADFAEAYSNRGIVLRRQNDLDNALENYDRAIALRPDYAEAHSNRGSALHALNRFEEALQSCDRAIALAPNYAEAHSNRGAALNALNRSGEALQSYDRAIALKPHFATALYNRGIVLVERKHFEVALQSYDRSIALKPDYAEAHCARAVALGELLRFDEALQSYDRALALKPDFDFLKGAVLHLKMRICEWTDYRRSAADLAERISRDEHVTAPFYGLAFLDSPALQRKAAENWLDAKYRKSGALGPLPAPAAAERTRIGYFSTDFRNHPVAHAIAELLERHDRQKFEIIAFSLGPDANDDIGLRLKAAFDRFINAENVSDRDIALRARELEIDIAVDLNGFTEGARPNIFALRAAPIQASYLGYPGTMGADYVDYLIADPTLVPTASQAHYAEKIVYLPQSFFPSDRRRPISERSFTRSELGLPQDGFVFCCFNNNYKITPDMFDTWMRILARVEGSVLWLRASNETAAANLRKTARLGGIEPGRLIFAPRMALADHLARHRMADLFLDTLPYNAHSTANDALWAGLPVLTEMGETFAGRVAASLLDGLDLPELVTTTRDDYEKLAIELATSPARLASIRRKLADKRLAAPLFDTDLLARHIERAYAAMIERHRAGLPPDHIRIGGS